MQQGLQAQQIFTIQLHIYSSHLFTFHNTFYVESFKRYAKGIIVNIVEHNHPLNLVSELPFAIVNASHIIPKPKLYDLFQAITSQTQIRLMYFRPIFKYCQQLAAVGRIMSQQSKNPYFLLLSPFKKYEVYKWNNKFRHQFYESTQYFNPYTQELNKEHFLYKIDTLASYVSQIDKTPMVLICVASLMKSLKIDNKVLYETAIKNEALKNCENNGFVLMNQQPPAERGQPRFIANVPIEGKDDKKDDEKKSQNKYNNPLLQLGSRLVVPFVVSVVFWRIHKYQTAVM